MIFILIGSTVFSHTFTAVDGNEWVEGLFGQVALERAIEAGALFTPERPRPDPALLLLQQLRETGAMPAAPAR